MIKKQASNKAKAPTKQKGKQGAEREKKPAARNPTRKALKPAATVAKPNAKVTSKSKQKSVAKNEPAAVRDEDLPFFLQKSAIDTIALEFLRAKVPLSILAYRRKLELDFTNNRDWTDKWRRTLTNPSSEQERELFRKLMSEQYNEDLAFVVLSAIQSTARVLQFYYVERWPESNFFGRIIFVGAQVELYHYRGFAGLPMPELEVTVAEHGATWEGKERREVAIDHASHPVKLKLDTSSMNKREYSSWTGEIIDPTGDLEKYSSTDADKVLSIAAAVLEKVGQFSDRLLVFANSALLPRLWQCCEENGILVIPAEVQEKQYKEWKRGTTKAARRPRA